VKALSIDVPASLLARAHEIINELLSVHHSSRRMPSG
jgi:hypothetical protein